MHDPSDRIIATKRLVLRPGRPEDRACFVRLEQDPDVMRYLNGGVPHDRARLPRDDTFLQPDGTEVHVWTALSKDGSSFVGWFCLWPETQSLAELGYRLARPCWGQGLASEGAAALIGWGFATRGYEKITASAMAVNHGSRRVMEKAGMRFTRTLEATWAASYPGTEQGEVEYAITRDGWLAHTPKKAGR